MSLGFSLCLYTIFSEPPSISVLELPSSLPESLQQPKYSPHLLCHAPVTFLHTAEIIMHFESANIEPDQYF